MGFFSDDDKDSVMDIKIKMDFDKKEGSIDVKNDKIGMCDY